MEMKRRVFLSAGAVATVAGLAKSAAQPFPPVKQIPAAVPGMAQPAWTPDEERLHTDWAYLEYYKAKNAEILKAPPSQRRVVFMGDSITWAWPDAHPTFFSDNGFVGRGIGGQTSPQMLVRFQQDVLSLRPKAVHIMAGTNDIAENTGLYDPVALQNNLKSMAELARTNGVRVILASITPAGEYPWRLGIDLDPAAKIPQMNIWIRQYAMAQDFIYADYTPVLDDGKHAMQLGLSHDGVHPTRAGYDLMEPVTLSAAKAALAQP